MAFNYNLRWFPGEDITLNFEVTPPQDISTWAMTFTVRSAPGGTTQFTKTVGGGITITDGGRGRYKVQINAADTSGLAVGDYEWSVKRTDTGFVTVLAHGSIVLEYE
jgi:hypothetical protein